MCLNLIHISLYLGPKASEDIVLVELEELLDDEEGEVVTEAVLSLSKHIYKVFPDHFGKSDRAVRMFYKFCDLANKCDMCLVDMARVLKKIGKFIVAFNRPLDQVLLEKVRTLLEKGMSASFDDEVRAMVPYSFEALCYVYWKNTEALLHLFEEHLQPFIRKEIESGKPPDKIEEEDHMPKSIYHDIIEKEKQKQTRESFDDQNFLSNRSIA